jgi:hypothetical protein
MGFNKPIAYGSVLALAALVMFFILQQYSTYFLSVEGMINNESYKIKQSYKIKLSAQEVCLKGEGDSMCWNLCDASPEDNVVIQDAKNKVCSSCKIIDNSLIAGTVFSFLLFFCLMILLCNDIDDPKLFQIGTLTMLLTAVLCSSLILGYQMDVKENLPNFVMAVHTTEADSDDPESNDPDAIKTENIFTHTYLRGFYITIATIVLEAIMLLLIYFGFRQKKIYSALRT